MGLEGWAGSLLGWGVSDGTCVADSAFERVGVGVSFVSRVGVGELVALFWKKPRMDFWFLADWEADAGGFFWEEARGVDISFPSMPRTMLAS